MFGPDDAVKSLADGHSEGENHITEKDISNLGLVPRSVITMLEQVNDKIAKAPTKRDEDNNKDVSVLEFTLKMNMAEIYNEMVNDLLSVPRQKRKIRQDPRKGI